jgi:hypothetical protein
MKLSRFGFNLGVGAESPRLHVNRTVSLAYAIICLAVILMPVKEPLIGPIRHPPELSY